MALGVWLAGLAAPTMITEWAQTTCSEFNPLVYSIDAFIPLVDLGQEECYRVTGAWYWWYIPHVASGIGLTALFVWSLTVWLRPRRFHR